MCGIAGVIDVDGVTLKPDPADLLPRMLRAIEHRGPDSSTWRQSGAATLGTVRLAMVDKPTSLQPMPDREGRYLLCFNGEIYNFRELRAELEASGAVFATSGDTEVLLYALVEWGVDALPRLRGQFALAFWDSVLRTLLLARDRFGIVPLFWTHPSGSRLGFASQVSALAEAGYDIRLSLNDVVDAGVLWGVHPGHSCFAGVRSVPPGGYVQLGGGDVQEGLYWEFAFAEERNVAPLAEQAAELARRLRTAVARRVPAYGDPAVLLSGGLDSSAVLAILRRMEPASTINSFSIRFASSVLDEEPFQQLASSAFATVHDGVCCDDESVAAALAEVVERAESPLVRTAPAASVRLAAHIKGKGIRAVLSGEGADELLCGYDLFKVARIRSRWATNPDAADQLTELENVMAQQKQLGRAIERAFYEQGVDDPDDPIFSHLNRWAASHRITQYLLPQLRELFPLERILDGVRERLPKASLSWSSVERAQLLEVRYFLAHSLLANQCDRPYMAHSIEARYPFLDEDVVDFALTLPERSKLEGTNEKRVLKEAMADDVPEAITGRVKQPYTAPEGDIFRSQAGDELLTVYASPRALRSVGIFDEKRVAWLIAKLKRGRTSFHDDLALLWVVSTQILGTRYGVADSVSPAAASQMIGVPRG
ncbi:asparagine synthase (glutamine-hydrolysing) [Paramicrobacterium humi]|uniref:asparagine synthase (glutamine-hydrolyzing) n=1 Tax=Paramicrobacterium humi TaxID=640635 RepID=A0A1H4MP44_9MICO|nr:asparagine synthase (glutamine-hydrolyzing) [Microbacterium humi]SEB84122.1 asparagine synthase (glutamine-hydrolysing) [Microbacterium humi]